jgi:tetrathionate reductase subunit B
MNRYAILIDHQSCWGCKACQVACKQENQAPDGISYIWVTQEETKLAAGRLDTVYRVELCRHCESPDCAEVCPVEAITKREDGLVILDQEICNGCAACIEACPYHAIGFDKQQDKAGKCNLCHHRVDQGLIPACADNICLAHCITFGPADQVEQMSAGKSWLKERLAEDQKGR